MKVIISESQYNRLIDNFITFLIEPHEVKTTTIYRNSMFWVKDGEIIAEIKNPDYFWLHYKIWGDISNQFGLEYNETQLVIKTWLEEHYNLGGLTPTWRASRRVHGVGRTL